MSILPASEKNRVVGIIDSGVGGLSLWDALCADRSDLDYVYCADHRYFPYGTKSEQLICDRILTITRSLARNHTLDALIIGCNTASTVALELLRVEFDFPIVGVVPAIKPAAMHSHSKVVTLLATEATTRRQYTESLIRNYAQGCMVQKIASQELVELAEQKLRNGSVDLQAVRIIVEQLSVHPNSDKIILACTHFPLLREELSQIFPTGMELIDSQLGIVNRMRHLLPIHSSHQSKTYFFATSRPLSLPNHLYLQKRMIRFQPLEC